ncbi:MAG TPA: hypothetical protein VGE45_08575 [Chloroflexia bacterium]|jgi:hypothetical protein
MKQINETASGRKRVARLDVTKQKAGIQDGISSVPREFEDLDRFETVMFDNAAQFVRLVTYVYERFDGKGLELSDAPIVTSVRIRPSLIRQLPQELTNGMRAVTNEDISAALAQYERDEALGIQEAFERFPFVEISSQQQSSQE